jgi:hypothetical protein
MLGTQSEKQLQSSCENLCLMFQPDMKPYIWGRAGNPEFYRTISSVESIIMVNVHDLM